MSTPEQTEEQATTSGAPAERVPAPPLRDWRAYKAWWVDDAKKDIAAFKLLVGLLFAQPVRFFHNEGKRLASHWLDVFFGWTTPARYSIFETLFGISFLYWNASYLLVTGAEWVTSYGYHPTSRNASWHYPDPQLFPYVPQDDLTIFTWVYVVLNVVFILGGFRRVLVWAMFGYAVYFQAIDQASAFTLSKLFIVYFLIMALRPPPRRLDDGRLMQAAWPGQIIALTLVIQYTTAGTCKLFWGDWFYRPDALFTFAQGLYKVPIAAWLVNHMPYLFWVGLTMASLFFEMFAFVLIPWRKTRYAALIFGFFFHMGIAVLMKDLIFFSFQMVTFYMFWIDDKEINAFTSWVRAKAPFLGPLLGPAG